MENKIVVKRTSRADTARGTFWRRVGMVALYSVSLLLVLVLIGMLFSIYVIVAAPVLWFLVPYLWSLRPGATIVVISDEGIAVPESKMRVVPWKDVRNVDIGWVSGRMSDSPRVQVDFVNAKGKEVTEMIDTMYTNYSVDELIDVIKKFWGRA